MDPVEQNERLEWSGGGGQTDMDEVYAKKNGVCAKKPHHTPQKIKRAKPLGVDKMALFQS